MLLTVPLSRLKCDIECSNMRSLKIAKNCFSGDIGTKSNSSGSKNMEEEEVDSDI